MTVVSIAAPAGARFATGGDLDDRAVEATFPAMGTEVHLVVVDGVGGLLDVGREMVERLEARWSRFRADSDVSRLNRARGAWTSVHPDTILLLERARTGWHVTGGRFDPTVLPAVIAAGYDATFALVEDRSGSPSLPVDGVPRARARPGAARAAAPGLGGLALDRRMSRARLPAGVGFDPGAIGKGLAADLVVERLLARGGGGVMANLGGDLRAAGHAPARAGWVVEVVVPGRTARPLLVLAEGAVATSTPAYRRWQHDGRDVHHLVDPAAGAPARRPARAATVVAGAGWLAEVLATSLVLGGPHDALTALGATGLAVDEDGAVRSLPGWEEYVCPTRRS